MLAVVFAVALFGSAALLFSVQPVAGKALLPLAGGTPAVWTTCLVFFQALLLLGYLYADQLAARVRPGRQPVVHLVVGGCGLLALLFVTADPAWVPDDTDDPAVGLVVYLAALVGLPFFALSATAPLLQRWFAASGHRHAADPYFLYAASNAGSLLGLFAYPFLIEPWLKLGDQRTAWAAGYAVVFGLVAVCGLTVRGAANETGEAAAPAAPLGKGRVARWVLLAAIPSSLLMSATAHLTTDVAPVPLLWVVPLGLYLVSFVVVFARWPDRARVVAGRVTPMLLVLLTLALVISATEPLVLVAGIHLGGLFAVALLCHGELAADRPGRDHLTRFYLAMSVGGVLGGVVNAVVAPVVFAHLGLLEYPVGVVLAALIRPRVRIADPLPLGERVAVRPGEGTTAGVEPLPGQPEGSPAQGVDSPHPNPPPQGGRGPDESGEGAGISPESRGFSELDAAALAGFAVLTLAAVRFVPQILGPAPTNPEPITRLVRVGLAFGIPAAVAFALVRNPVRFAGCLAVMFVAARIDAGTHGDILVTSRNFFGTLRVAKSADGEFVRLVHGTTQHGQQRTAERERPKPLMYYHPAGPVGRLFVKLPADRTRRVGVVGLGCGAMAAYAEPGQAWTFFEIDPAVVRIARDSGHFTYLSACRVEPRIVVGDARRTLAREPDGSFDFLVLDAFSSDAIPAHLLTREAFAVYARKLAPHGVLAFHLSNRYLDLPPLVARVAAAHEPPFATKLDEDGEGTPDGKFPSTWVVLARDPADLGKVAADGHWQPVRPTPGPVWTDDFTNLLGVWKRAEK